MTRKSLKEFLQSEKQVDLLCDDLLDILDDGGNPVFDKWDSLQSMTTFLDFKLCFSESNRAVMLESSSLLFSLLGHLESCDAPNRSLIV